VREKKSILLLGVCTAQEGKNRGMESGRKTIDLPLRLRTQKWDLGRNWHPGNEPGAESKG